MIYVDVTGACLLPLQSGIPRTTRGVYRLLSENEPERTKPIFWQPFRGRYTALSARSQALLRDPFPAGAAPSRTPRDWTLPLLGASFRDLLRWPNLVPLDKLLGPDDILLLTSIFPDNRLEYLSRLAAQPGRRIALFHDAIPLRDPAVPEWGKRRHLKILRLLSRQHLVIAVSRSAEKDLHELWQRQGMAPAPTRVIPWPVPFTQTRPDFSEPPWEKKKILYVSRLKPLKNHATLFAACEKLWSGGADFALELIGCEDVAWESRRILREVARLRAAGRPILWRGHLPENELHLAYRGATFTVFPSLAEGFGLPVIESGWHGRGVVCGDDGAVGELTSDGGCLVADVRDAGALAAALQSLLLDREKNLALAREAYARPIRSWSYYWGDLRPLLA